jgi:hypothetical protein
LKIEINPKFPELKIPELEFWENRLFFQNSSSGILSFGIFEKIPDPELVPLFISPIDFSHRPIYRKDT